MNPRIATLICIGIVFYLFRTEKFKGDYRPSRAMWIPYIWFLMGSCRAVSMWVYGIGPSGVADASFLEGNPLDRNLYFLLIIVGFFLMKQRNFQWGDYLRQNPAVFVFLGYCFISFIWSDVPDQALKRWIKGGAGNMIMVMIIITEKKPLEAVRSLFFRIAYFIVPVTMTLMRYYPEFGRTFDRSSGDTVYIGVAYGKNPMGALNFICGFALFWDILNRIEDKSEKKLSFPFMVRIGLFGIMWMTFQMIHSTTPMVCLVISIAAILLLSLPFVRNNLERITVYVILFMALVVTLEKTLDLSTKIILALGKDPSLTGRDVIWKDVLQEKFNHFVGAGYESFWSGRRLHNLWEKHWWHPKQAHNGYIENYINLGIVGSMLLAYLIWATYRKCIYEVANRFESGRFRLGFFVAALVYNYSEAAFSYLQPFWVGLLFLSANTPPESDEEELEEDHDESDFEDSTDYLTTISIQSGEHQV